MSFYVIKWGAVSLQKQLLARALQLCDVSYLILHSKIADLAEQVDHRGLTRPVCIIEKMGLARKTTTTPRGCLNTVGP